MNHFVIYDSCFCLCYAVLPVHCSLVSTYWERADLLVILCVMFSCVFVFPYGVPGQARNLIIAIPEFCLLLYYAELWRVIVVLYTITNHTQMLIDQNKLQG